MPVSNFEKLSNDELKSEAIWYQEDADYMYFWASEYRDKIATTSNVAHYTDLAIAVQRGAAESAKIARELVQELNRRK